MTLEPPRRQGAGGVARRPAGGGRDGFPHRKIFSKMPMIRELELAPRFGLSRADLAVKRRQLVEGEHWLKEGRPKAIWWTQKGLDALGLAVGLPETPKAADAPAAAVGHRIPDDQIPRGPQNGLILEHGRPGWWTADEALVVSNVFANRKAILVEFEGKQVICRVKDATNFHPRMVIPVRKYGNIVLAARQPRFPGKW